MPIADAGETFHAGQAPIRRQTATAARYAAASAADGDRERPPGTTQRGRRRMLAPNCRWLPRLSPRGRMERGEAAVDAAEYACAENVRVCPARRPYAMKRDRRERPTLLVARDPAELGRRLLPVSGSESRRRRRRQPARQIAGKACRPLHLPWRRPRLRPPPAAVMRRHLRVFGFWAIMDRSFYPR